MRKIIALTTLIAAGSSLAQTTSTTEVSTSKKTLKERIGVSWFAEAQDKMVGNSEEGVDGVSAQKDVEVYNSVSLSYEINEKMKAVFNPRFTISDAGDDRMDDHDLRLRLNGSYINPNIYTSLSFIVPTSANTLNGDTFDGQVRFYNDYTAKIDNVNTITAGADIRKTFTKNTPGDVSLYSILPYVSYVNNSLSEKVGIRVDYEGYLSQNAGKDFNSVTIVENGDRLLVGANLKDVGPIDSLYPYVTHYPQLTKTTESLGIGAQIFKKF